MKDIQITVDSFKKFSQNIFTIDNVDDLTIRGNKDYRCKFKAVLANPITLQKKDYELNPIEWDVYLTSVFIGGYKQEQYARPGCLFNNVQQKWNGELRRRAAPNAPSGSIDFDSSNNKIDNRGYPKATYSIFHKTDLCGNYELDDAALVGAGTHQYNYPTNYNLDYHDDASNPYVRERSKWKTPFSFGHESVHAFCIRINDNNGASEYTANNFISAFPEHWSWFKGGSDNTFYNFGWGPENKNVLNSFFDRKNIPQNPSVSTGRLVLINEREQRTDGFDLSGSKIEETVVDGVNQKGQLTVQDYMPFIYEEGNNPIYLTTLNGGHTINDITIDITDQNGYSIWHQAHVSQMQHQYGIDANPPTQSRRLIFKLTYKPKIKRDMLLESIDRLSDNITKLFNLKPDDKPIS